MANKTGDPIAFWQQMVGEMQKSFSALTQLRPAASTPRSSSSDSTTGSGQKPMVDLMENYFAGMNMPSRAQLNALNERLAGIEAELGETRVQLNELLAASKAPPPAMKPAVDVTPQLSEIKGLLTELLAASKAPQPAAKPPVDVTPQLSEIKTLLNQMLNVARAPGPVSALESELREIKAAIDLLSKRASQSVEAAPQPAELAPQPAEPAPRPAKSRNKKPGAMTADQQGGPGQDRT